MPARIACLMQIAPPGLEAIESDPALAVSILEADEGDVGFLDIDKSWHGIHFLLAGGARGGQALPVDVILGGTEVRPPAEGGGAPVRFLTPGEVQEAALALSKVSTRQLWARFDKAVMTNARIYPEFWEEKKDAVEYLLFYFEKLVAYYEDAARRGNGMLIRIT